MKQFLFIALAFISFNTSAGEFDFYKKSFKDVFEVPVHTKIVFAKGRIINEGTLAGAICKPFHNLIVIDKAYWSTLDFSQKTQLMFHELGHCVLYLAHSNEKDLRKGCKASVMHPVLFDKQEAKCFVEHFKYYILEMIYRVKTNKFII